MANGKNVKRQRQKEMRRAKLEQEMKQRQIARRRQRTIFFVLLALVAAGAAYGTGLLRPDDPAEPEASPGSRAAGECSHTKPPGGNTETPSSPPPMTIDATKKYTAVFETSCGTLEAELAADISPNTVNSFVFLARKGFYNGLSFHRIVKDFAIQGGDPKGDGTGGPNYKTVDPPPAGFKYEKGTIAMAKGQPEPAGTAGSQFFFVPGDGAGLEPLYAVLGKVVKGLDVLEKLNDVPTKAGGGGEQPAEPIYIEKITIDEPTA